MRIGFTASYAFCALLGASTVSAQQLPPDPATILKSQGEQTAQLAATWLHSGDPRLQAWGAYVALRDQRKELVPELLALADAYEVTGLPVLNTRREQHDAMLAVLDAVIQMDGRVGVDEAAKFYEEFPTQSMILLSRTGDDSNNALLRIFRTEHFQSAWLAAGNILAERRAKGFAAAVLGGMTVHMSLVVTSPDGSGGGSGSSYCGDSFGLPPDNRTAWPEIGTYSFAYAEAGATLLADGADPAYYIRKVGRRYSRPEGSGHCGNGDNEWDLLRQHYLTRLLGEEQENPPMKSSIYDTIIWEDPKTYLEYLQSFVRQQELKFTDVANRLKEGCLITDEELSGLKPHVEIRITDERENKTTPLPRIENLGDNVLVKM